MLKRFVKRLLSCLLLAALFVLVIIGGTLGVQGWRLYRATASQKPIASLYDEISSRPGFASCDQLPQTYIDAVISVEDSRFERHHGIDPAAIVRAHAARQHLSGGGHYGYRYLRSLQLPVFRSLRLRAAR